MDLKGLEEWWKENNKELGGNNRKLEVSYTQGKDNNEKLKSSGKSQKRKVSYHKIGREREEERTGLWGYDRKDSTVVRDLKVMEGNR